MTKVEKVFNKLLVIDASYLLHRNMNVKNLWDLKSSDGTRTGGIMGFFRSLNSMMDHEYYPVLCWDSKVSPRRLEIYPDYKKNLTWKTNDLVREQANKVLNESYSIQVEDVEVPDEYDDTEESFLDQVKEQVDAVMKNRSHHGTDHDPDDYGIQYRDQRYKIMEVCRALGIPSLRYHEWEGDDLVALCTRMTNKSVVVTDDWDMVQLLDPDGSVDISRILNKQYLTHDEFLKDNDYSSMREFVISKSIQGDGSDNIPKVAAGCGPKRADQVARVIYESNEDPEVYLPALENGDLSHYKFMKNFLANHEGYLRNVQLIDLSLVPNDKEILEKMIADITVEIGNTDMMLALQKLGELEITNLDINTTISKLNVSSLNCLIK